MRSLVLVKLGGSLITDKTKLFASNLGTIRQLSYELHSAFGKKESLFIIGNGGGSYSHPPAKKYRTFEGVIKKSSLRGIAEVQDAAARLNRIVVRNIIEAGENAVSLNPSSFISTKNGKIKRAFLPPLFKLLELKMLPVVYGDVVLDLKMGCSILSTEKILNFLALKLKSYFQIDKVIHCGKTNGVYDYSGKTISRINDNNYKNFRKSIGQSEGEDVTGGMTHKVKEALVMARKGVPSLIINGQIKYNLRNALLGNPVLGTIIS